MMPGAGSVVKQVLRQQHHRLDEIGLDERPAYVALLVRSLVAAPAADGAAIEHDRHAPAVRQRGGHVLNPKPQSALDVDGRPRVNRPQVSVSLQPGTARDAGCTAGDQRPPLA